MSEDSTNTPAARVQVLILNGFLGSGKTTLLTSLLSQSFRRGLAVAAVVNDMSDLDVDGQLMAQRDFFEDEPDRFASIAAHVLSSYQGMEKLGEAVDRILAADPPELLIVETSGSCHPLPLVEFFHEERRLKLTGVLTLVDTAMIDQDYDRGDSLVPTLQRNVEEDKRDTTNLLIEQIMLCSHLMLTKTDRVVDTHVAPIAQAIHEVNPLVPVIGVPFGNLPLDDVLAMAEYDYGRVAKLIQELKPILAAEREDERPYNLAARVIRDDRPFHPERLWEVCNHYLGQHIYRSKGFFYLASRDDLSLLWNQAAAGISLELVGVWRAAVVEEAHVKFTPEEIEGLRKKLEDAPGRFGDRRCQLTVIGDATQVDYFVDALEACFLTEEEIERWRSGGTFDDPWPEDYAKIEY